MTIRNFWKIHNASVSPFISIDNTTDDIISHLRFLMLKMVQRTLEQNKMVKSKKNTPILYSQNA